MTFQHDEELSIFQPQQASKGVVLICPGGGYSWLSPREGEPVAGRFNEAGWTVAVLTYACFAGQPLGDLPLRQAGEALAVLRERFAGQRIVFAAFLRAAIWRLPWAYIGGMPGFPGRMA